MKARFNDGKTDVAITGIPSNMSTAQLAQLIDDLSRLREQMRPSVRVDPPDDAIRAIPDPHMGGRSAWVEGRIAMLVRHPGYGWLAFAIKPEAAKELAAHLLTHSAGESGAAN